MYSGSLKLQYYRTGLIQTRRGNNMGRIINAKPIFLIALFDQIEKKQITDNKILFNCGLRECYERYYSTYEPEMKITPFYKPFFHLQTDGYWHIIWKDATETKTPSDKYLRESVKYATVDNALWDLLQDEQSRFILRDVVINHFLTGK